MRLAVRIAYILVLNLVTFAGQAADIVRFPGVVVSPAQIRIQHFLATGDVEAIRNIRLVGLNDLRFVFSKALERIANVDASADARERAKTILQLRISTDPEEVLKTAALLNAKDLANRLLRLLPAIDYTQTSLLLLMNKFDLWSSQHAWFLIEKASSVESLRALNDIIVNVAPEFSERQFDDLELALRDIEPRHKIQLRLLQEIGRLNEDDIVALLDIASMDFARTLSRAEAHPENALLARNFEDWMSLDNQMFAGLLQHVKHQLALKDAETTRAFQFAKRTAAESETLSRQRLLFFDALKTDLFDWLDRERWLGARPAPVAKPKITAKVIEGRFKKRSDPNCGGNFEN